MPPNLPAARARASKKPNGGAPASWRQSLLILALLATATLLVYSPTIEAEFINLDDDVYVTENPHVQAGVSWEGTRWALTSWEAANWHPLTWLSLQLDAEVSRWWPGHDDRTVNGMDAGQFHLTNVLLHTSNTLLLFGLLCRWTGAPWKSAVVAGLFGLHPLHVESVAWVAERKDVLSTFFFLLTLAAYTHYVQRPGLGRYLLVLVLDALGLMSKPMLVTLPFLLLLLDFWPLGRTGEARQAGSWRSVGTLILEKVPLVALALASSWLTVQAQQQGQGLRTLGAYPLDIRILNVLNAYGGYLLKMFWPTHLIPFYRFAPERLLLWRAAFSLLLLVTLTVVAFLARRQRPYLLVGWLWYVGTLVPVIGFVQVGDQALADRYMYIPLVGIFLALVWLVGDLVARWHVPPFTQAAVAAGLLVGYMVLSSQQVGYWHDGLTLWSHTLVIDPDNPLAHNNLGSVLQRRGRDQEAVGQFQKAVELEPDYVAAQTNLGGALERVGRLQDALVHYREAVHLDPRNADAQYNLGLGLAHQGEIDEATAHFTEAIRLRPGFARAHNNLGTAYLSQRRFEPALREFVQAVALQPGYDLARKNLAGCLQAINNEAWLLATSSEPQRRNGRRAQELGRLLGEFTHEGEPDYLDTWAAACANVGDYELATALVQQALAAARLPFERREAMQARLVLYREHQPFRDVPGKRVKWSPNR